MEIIKEPQRFLYRLDGEEEWKILSVCNANVLFHRSGGTLVSVEIIAPDEDPPQWIEDFYLGMIHRHVFEFSIEDERESFPDLDMLDLFDIPYVTVGKSAIRISDSGKATVETMSERSTDGCIEIVFKCVALISH